MDKTLEQFMAIAEAGSYLAAAEILSVSQPALTYNLKKLEASLGIKVFERSSRGVRLTSYGETLYESALVMRRLYSNALESIERQRAEHEEGIRIGTGYSTWNLFLKEMIVEHYKQHPNAPINVSLGNTLRCMDQLLAGDITLFIGHRIEDLAHENTVEFIPIGETRDSYFVRKNHPLLGKTRSREEVQAYPTVLAAPREARQKRLLNGKPDSRSRQRPEYHEHAFTSNSLYACLDFVQETNMVLIHSTLLSPLLADRDIAQVKVHGGDIFPSSTMGIYVRNEQFSDPKVQTLINQIIAERAKVLNLQSDNI